MTMLSIEYRYFLQSAKDLSIRRASLYLNVNSSAVVRQIKKLEYKLNTSLFMRNSRGLTLTNQGKILFDFLISQEEIFLDFSDRFDIEKGKIKGTYRIGMMESIGTNTISPLLKVFQSKYPDIKFDIYAKKPEKILDELINQKLDIGITFSQFLPKSIRKLSERQIPIGIVTSLNHPLQSKGKLVIEDIRKYPIVMHTGALTFFRQAKKDIGLDIDFLDLSITSNSLNFIKKSLMNNENLVSLSLAASQELDAKFLLFREIENEITKKTQIGILCLASKKFTESENFFNQLLIDEFTKRITK